MNVSTSFGVQCTKFHRESSHGGWACPRCQEGFMHLLDRRVTSIFYAAMLGNKPKRYIHYLPVSSAFIVKRKDA